LAETNKPLDNARNERNKGKMLDSDGRSKLAYSQYWGGCASRLIFLRFVALFVGVALSIKKSSSFLPSLIAANNHLGVAPRPAHSSPDGPLGKSGGQHCE
jgi:hypothetical protein